MSKVMEQEPFNEGVYNMELIESDLNPQIEEAIQRLVAEEKKTSTVRSLLVAVQSQLKRMELRIRKLEKRLKAYKDIKEV